MMLMINEHPSYDEDDDDDDDTIMIQQYTAMCVFVYSCKLSSSFYVYFIFNHHSITCLPLTSRFLFVIFIFKVKYLLLL